MHHLIERSRNRLLQWHLQAVRLAWGVRPVSTRYWAAVRSGLARLSNEPNPLAPHVRSQTSDLLRTPELRMLLRDDLLGTWALDPGTLDFLWVRVQQARPRILLECGAGSSTLALAAYAEEVRRTQGDEVRIVSVEQSSQVRQDVEGRLAQTKLEHHVQIIETPTAADGSYAFDLDALREALSGGTVTWILIDGPAGPDGCRTSTLTQLLPLCAPGARWYLDDAFRDGELQTLQTWAEIPEIAVEGIYPIGKGVATGTVAIPPREHALSATAKHDPLETRRVG